MYDRPCSIYDEEAWQEWLWQLRCPPCRGSWGCPPPRVRPEPPHPHYPPPRPCPPPGPPCPPRPCPPSPEPPCPPRPCPPSEPPCSEAAPAWQPAPLCPPEQGEAEICCELPGFCCLCQTEARVERSCCSCGCCRIWLRLEVSYQDRRGCYRCRVCRVCRELPLRKGPFCAEVRDCAVAGECLRVRLLLKQE